MVKKYGKQKIALGDKVVDKITGFEGVATAYYIYLNGCEKITVEPPVDKEGKMLEGWNIDIQQLERVRGKTLEVEKRKVGGARTRAIRS